MTNTESFLPLISIVTATYNAARTFSRAAESVRAQTYKNIEWIVIDGASSDGTADLIRDNADIVTLWLSEKDQGIYDAWNKGIAMAHGEWVAFLGADDAYLPDAIEQYVRYIQANNDKQFDYVSSRVALVNAEQEIIEVIGRGWNWPKFLKKMNVAHVGSLHHRSLYKRYGLYDTTYKTAADYELLLRAGDSLSAGFLDIVTARMQFGGASNNMIPALIETKRAKHETGGRTAFLCYFDNLVDMTKIIIKRNLNWKYRC